MELKSKNFAIRRWSYKCPKVLGSLHQGEIRNLFLKDELIPCTFQLLRGDPCFSLTPHHDGVLTGRALKTGRGSKQATGPCGMCLTKAGCSSVLVFKPYQAFPFLSGSPDSMCAFLLCY